MWLSKSLKLIFQHVEKLTILYKEEEVCSENEIIEFVKNGLSRYKAPRYVHFLDNYPMTASGKIQKYKLREMAIELLQLEDEASIETA
jgi:fatty-acyl-CoA synthase